MNESEHPVRDIFSEALEISDSGQRAAFLDRACDRDAGLRREVEQLLQAEAGAGKFLPDKPAATTSRSALQELADAAQPFGAIPSAALTEKPGDRIGRYELLEKIGEGGCGVVYLAQQETPVRRQVALKIIKLGMDTRQVIVRFEAERQALAMMDHPNIAKVFDAGATETPLPASGHPLASSDDGIGKGEGNRSQHSTFNSQLPSGRPYFVMELVRGVKITDYCNQHQLATRARLELFIQVCQAVQHAHQKGIIHRDLKPSNILVAINDGVPVPKVIDFGIAKATEGKLTDQTLFTAFEQFLGTPAYMSPEQAAMTNQDIDTRSDVYSLGVLLYELLTGTTPFDTKTLLASGVDELRRTIREKEPKRPSTRLTQELQSAMGSARVPRAESAVAPDSHSGKHDPGHGKSMSGEVFGATPKTARETRALPETKDLIRQVRGDLDWIVMKCLEKDRARRYETANGLAADLKRHLNNEPVVARPPSRLYEFQKTVRRHKVGFAATAAVIVVLVLGVFASAWQAIRATRLRRQAEAESYTSDMNLAMQAWDEGNLRRAQALLRAHIPKPGEPDPRGFEWRYLWNLFGKDESLKIIAVTNDPVQLLASAPAHSFVVVCCKETIRLLDPTTGNELHRFPHPNPEAGPAAHAIALASGARNLLATYRADGEVRLWDLDRRALLLSFQAVFTHLDRAAIGGFLALSPDGRFLATGSPGAQSAELILWDVSATPQRAPQALWTNAVPYGVMRLAFTPDGRTLVTAGSFRGSTLRTWDVMTGAEGKPFQKLASGSILALAISPGGALVAHAGVEGRIHVLDFATRRWKCTFDGHSGYVYSLAFSPDGRRLISGGDDGTIRVWDIPSEKPVGLWYDPASLKVSSTVFTPDGSSIVSANPKEIRFWSADPRPPEPVIETGQETGHMAISPDGKWFVTSDAAIADRSVLPAARVWEIASRQEKFQLAYKNRHPLTLAFSSKSNLFAIGDVAKEGFIGLWNTASWDNATARVEPFRYLTNGFEAGSLCFSPDGTILAVAGLQFISEDPSHSTNRLAFWAVGTWTKLNLLPGAGTGATEGAAAASVAFSHDGRLVAVGHRNGWVRLWDFKRGALVMGTNANGNFNFGGACVQFSGDDRWLVSYMMGSTSLVLFDLGDVGRARAVLSTSDPAAIWGATFAPDNKSLVTADNDGLVKFWNLKTFRVALTLRHSHGPGGRLAFAPDGNQLASEDEKGLVKLWTAPSLEEIDKEREANEGARARRETRGEPSAL